MIIVFFIVYIIVSCLPLICFATYHNTTSMPICPESFSCGPDLAPFNYPFYNATESSECGLIKVHCSTTTTSNVTQIQLGNHSYQITARPFPGSSVFIHNKTFEDLIKANRCEALDYNFTSPAPLLFSISIQTSITLYKCTNHSNYAHTFFNQHNYRSYNRCKDHNFYYKYSFEYTQVPSDILHTCQVIQLPVKLEEKLDDTNIFSLLSANISLSFHATPFCSNCHERSGQCTTSNGQIQCLHAKKEKTHINLTLILFLALIFGAMATLMVIILCFRICFRMTSTWRTKARNDVNENFLKNHEFLAPKRYSYSQVKKMTNTFKVKLGQGGFGSVYKGTLSNGNLVAVKVLSELKGKGEDFINEVASVGRTSHVNIVCLVGFCLEGNQRALIYEFMPNGSLERFIYGWGSSSNSHLGWGKLQQIAIGIARGLEYLHSGCNTRILHFDIKPHNILLDKDFCPKISDFGLAKLFPNERSMISVSRMRGTPGYIAPELFSRSFGHVSHKSDVYSYGMMILEMVGGRKNIEVEVDHTSEIYFPHWIYKKVELHEEELGLDGIVNEEENEMARKMIIVGLWCIQTNPLSRPTITKVLEMLEGDLELLEIPPKPYLSSPSRSVGSSSTN